MADEAVSHRRRFMLTTKTRNLKGKNQIKRRAKDVMSLLKLEQLQNMTWGSKQVRKGKTFITVDYQELKFNNLIEFAGVLDRAIPKLFDNLIDSTLRALGKDINNTTFGIEIEHPSLVDTKGFFLGFRNKQTLNGTAIYNLLSNAAQSNRSFKLDEQFLMRVYIYEPSKSIFGRGFPAHVKPTGLVRNLDNLCLIRAVIMGMADADVKHARRLKDKSKRFDMRKLRIWKNDSTCRKEALKILNFCSISPFKPSYNLQDLEKIANHFTDYHFEVYSNHDGTTHLVFSSNPDSHKKVSLYHADNHFDLARESFEKSPLNLLHVISSQKSKIDGVFCDVTSLITEFNLLESEISLDTVKIISEKYQNYNFCVYQRELGAKKYKTVFSSNPSSFKTINIDYSNDLFAFFTPSRRNVGCVLCKYCGKTYVHTVNHRCPFKCTKCHTFDCPKTFESEIVCEGCLVYFNSQICYEKHLEPNFYGLSVCEKFKACLECGAYIRLFNLHGKQHECGKKKFCSFCRERVTGRRHDCCWSPPSEVEKSRLVQKQERFKMIFYDFETVICEDPLFLIKDGEEQYPNFVCFDVICHRCFVSGDETCCPSGYFSYTNHLESRWSVTDAFLDFLLKDPSNNEAIVVAHNAGGFDCHFILKRLLVRGVYPTVIKNGYRIMKMSVRDPSKKVHNNLDFKDSFALIPAPLADLPKAFNIPNISKGDFPYYFNKPCNYGQTLTHLPSLKYYGINSKSLKKKKELEAFWMENCNTMFNFDFEILKYCMDDVKILRKAVVAYMKANLDLTGWNPLIVSNTFAGFTLHIISFNYLKPKTLGVIHENGIFANQTQSKLALKYIQWIEQQEGVQYQHFLNAGEFEVDTFMGKFRVDAYRDGVAIEVMGCAVHGCPKCFDSSAKHMNKKGTNKNIFDKTMMRVKILERTGLKVKVVWEHEIRAMLQADKQMAKFFKECVRTHRLRPRDAFLGGRTQTYKMFHEVGPDEKYERWDVNSLYPFITGFWAEFPLGSPEIIVKDFTKVPEKGPLPYKGLIMLEALPPRNLPFPILGTKVGNKLLFPLCNTCALKRANTGICHHCEDERKIFVTTTHIELNLALEHGYKIIKIYEVWNWPRWEKGGLFSDFVKKFYKIKQESSGWPHGNMTDLEKENYLKNIREVTDVELDPRNIEVNSARKTCAKYMLNSSWGKFGVNINLPVTVFLKGGSDELHSLVESKKDEITYLKEIVTDVFCVSYKSKEDLATQPRYTNVVISIFTTASARNYHWQFLHEIQKKLGRKAVTYVDTDCIHYVCKKDQELLEEWKGDVLGKLVDETPPGWRVTRFVSPAPKSYAIELKDDAGNTDYIVKCKGITLDADASLKIGFESMYEQVSAFVAGLEIDPIVTSRAMIKKKLGSITTLTVEKITRPVMDKVWYGKDYTTVPYGYDMEYDDTEDVPRR